MRRWELPWPPRSHPASMWAGEVRGPEAWARAGGSHALTRDYVHKWWALSRQVKKGGPGTRSAPSLRTAPPVKTRDFFPSEADLPCEGLSQRSSSAERASPRLLSQRKWPKRWSCESSWVARMGHLHIHKSQCKHTHGYGLSMDKDKDLMAVHQRGSFWSLLALRWYKRTIFYPSERKKGSSLSASEVNVTVHILTRASSCSQDQQVHRLFCCRESMLIMSMASQECVWTLMAQRNHIPMVHGEKIHG